MTIRERGVLAIIVGIILSLILSLSNTYLASHYIDLKRYKAPSLFNEIIKQIQSEYIDEVEYDILVKSAVTGVLSDLDEYSEILSNDDYRQIRISANGVYSGVGLKIYQDSGHIKIADVINNTAAFYAGIEPDDEIIEIDNEQLKDSKLNIISQKLDGKLGSEVTLLIKKLITNEIIHIKLIREKIYIPSVFSKMLTSNHCYIKLDKFNNQTQKEVNNTINNDCLSNNVTNIPIKGLIIDIRNNLGGTLESAVNVSDLFLNEGIIVTAKGRDNVLMFVREASKDRILADLPIAIIVNKYSASAAEIFAGAMQDNKRAIIVGTATYGKGSIQSVIPLSDGGAIKLTTARYFRPSGKPISELGIRPDILVKSSMHEDSLFRDIKGNVADDIQLSEAINILNRRIKYYH